MKLMWTLLLLLHIAQADSRDAAVCDARVNNAQCYGALGGTIKIQLMDSSSTIHRCRWWKNNTNVFEWKDSKTRKNEFQNRSDVSAFNHTGIIQIVNLSKSDNNSYKVDIFYENGTSIKQSDHKLIIEAPVSSVLLQPECLSEGEVRASCVSQGGDSPVYSWTLNGQNLTEFDLLSKNYENNITLRQNTKGRLRCSVHNHISQNFSEIHINSCGQTTASTTTSVSQTRSTNHSAQATNPSPQPVSWYTHITQHWPIIVGSLVAIIAGVAIICVLKKCKKRRDKEPDQELTYANVRILKQQETRRPRSEVEVVYGQVKFSQQSPHTSTAEDNCIYSKVRG